MQKTQKLSNPKPEVGIGTKLPQGTVVSINHDSITVEKNSSKATLSFAQVESYLKKEQHYVFKQSQNS